MSDAPIVMCAFASIPTEFLDNVKGVCSRCGVAIQWRPHAPPYPKVCLSCCATIIEHEPNPEFFVTEDTEREMTAYIRSLGRRH